MVSRFLSLGTVLGLLIVAGQASALCSGGDSIQTCSNPFSANGAASQPQDGTNSTQGFDAQTGSQWSKSTNSLGGFNFTTGYAHSDGFGGVDPSFSNRFGNTQNLNGPAQADPSTCALYGTCR